MNSCRRSCLLRLLPLALLPFLSLAPAAEEGGALAVSEDDIKVSRQGEAWIVDASFSVPVPPALAWEVLTDFDHMAGFVSDLSLSRVVSRQGNVLQVEQQGRAHVGLFSVNFESLREITLHPIQRIQVRGISGSTKRFNSELTLSPESGGARIVYRAETVPDFWLPGFIGGSLLRHQMAGQFSAVVREMQRRQ